MPVIPGNFNVRKEQVGYSVELTRLLHGIFSVACNNDMVAAPVEQRRNEFLKLAVVIGNRIVLLELHTP